MAAAKKEDKSKSKQKQQPTPARGGCGGPWEKPKPKPTPKLRNEDAATVAELRKEHQQLRAQVAGKEAATPPASPERPGIGGQELDQADGGYAE